MRLFGRRRVEATAVQLDLTGEEPVIRLGYPRDCPECGHHGYLDHVDIEQGEQTEHCPSCGHRWRDRV